MSQLDLGKLRAKRVDDISRHWRGRLMTSFQLWNIVEAPLLSPLPSPKLFLQISRITIVPVLPKFIQNSELSRNRHGTPP